MSKKISAMWWEKYESLLKVVPVGDASEDIYRRSLAHFRAQAVLAEALETVEKLV